MSNGTLFDVVTRLSKDLDEEGILHALTGSVVAGLYGEPITSLDVDVVVMSDVDGATRLARRWERDLCADEESFRQAAESHGIASMLHFPSGLKVDISVLPDTPYYHDIPQALAGVSPLCASVSLWWTRPSSPCPPCLRGDQSSSAMRSSAASRST